MKIRLIGLVLISIFVVLAVHNLAVAQANASGQTNPSGQANAASAAATKAAGQQKGPIERILFENIAGNMERAAAAMAKDPPDVDAANEEMRDAMGMLIEGANRGLDVDDLANDIAEIMVGTGGMSQSAADHFEALLAILRRAQEIRAGSTSSTLEQDMAIREILNGLRSITDSGSFDYWHSLKALRWYINATASGTYIAEIIEALLAYSLSQEDITPAGKDRISEVVRDLADRVAKDPSKVNVKSETDRIRDIISEETRAASEIKKARYRKEDAEAERREREEEEATKRKETASTAPTASSGQGAAKSIIRPPQPRVVPVTPTVTLKPPTIPAPIPTPPHIPAPPPVF